MHCSKETIQSEKERLGKFGIPSPIFQEQGDFIFLKRSMKKGLQAISADPYHCKVIKFVTLPGTSDEQETKVLHEIRLRQGDWVEAVYERETFWSNNSDREQKIWSEMPLQEWMVQVMEDWIRPQYSLVPPVWHYLIACELIKNVLLWWSVLLLGCCVVLLSAHPSF